MQSEPGRYINSVSDLYGADEIEVLLEEIRDLEPASCRPEDIQDFEIAGSQTGVATAGIDCESPAVTVRSWDSHANYRHQLPESSPTASLFSGVILYCDETHLKSSTGVVRVLLVCNKLAASITANHSQGLAFPTVTQYHSCKIIHREIRLACCSVLQYILQISSVACLACLCSSGTVKVGLFMLPLIGRLRLMMFVTVFSLLVTCLFIFLDISHIVYFFPFNWGKLNALFYVSVSVLYLIGSSLVIHLIHMYHESYSWVPKWTRDQLLVTGILGYLCALEALLLSIITRRSALKYSPVDEDPSQMTLPERQDRELQPMGGSQFPSSTSLQLQVPPPNQLPSSQQHKQQKQRRQQQQQKKQQIQQKQQKQQKWPAAASTSAPAPRVWPVDDVQPCSSKYPDPYMVA